MSRVAFLVVLCSLALGQYGCSFLFIDRVPPNSSQLNSFDCTSSAAAPVLDLIWAGLNGVGAANAAGSTDQEWASKGFPGDRSTTMAVGFHLGGAVSDHVIIAAHLFDVAVPSPTFTVTDSQGSQSMSPPNTSMAGLEFGPEFTFYTSSNLYLSVTAAITKLSRTVNGQDTNSQTGFGGQLAVGKEWWVSDNWGIGICGQLTLSVNADQSFSNGNQPTITAVAPTLSLSATFN